jgi:hypothetical protein
VGSRVTGCSDQCWAKIERCPSACYHARPTSRVGLVPSEGADLPIGSIDGHSLHLPRAQKDLHDSYPPLGLEETPRGNRRCISEGTVATLLMAWLYCFTERPASSRPASRSTKSRRRRKSAPCQNPSVRLGASRNCPEK